MAVRYGHEAGKSEPNSTVLKSAARQAPPRPLSPEEKRVVMPRRPRRPTRLQVSLA